MFITYYYLFLSDATIGYYNNTTFTRLYTNDKTYLHQLSIIFLQKKDYLFVRKIIYFLRIHGINMKIRGSKFIIRAQTTNIFNQYSVNII